MNGSRSLAEVQTHARWCEHNAEKKGHPASGPVCDLCEKTMEGRDSAETAPSGESGLRATSGKKNEARKKRIGTVDALIIAC